MILEQRGVRGQTPKVGRCKRGSGEKSLRNLQDNMQRDPSTSQLTTKLRFRSDDKWREELIQLFSLLARFQEINSPMVELVLETGCL